MSRARDLGLQGTRPCGGWLELPPGQPERGRPSLCSARRHFVPERDLPGSAPAQAYRTQALLPARIARRQGTAQPGLRRLLRAAQAPGAPAMLLIASLRRSADGVVMDPLLCEFVEQPGVETIKLDPLSPENTRALVGNLLDEEKIAPAVERRIADAAVQEAGGNPFFVVELVHP